MEKLKCPLNKKIIVTKEYVDNHCLRHCGNEQFLKCLDGIDSEEKITDEVILEPSIIYLGFDILGMA